MNQNNSPKKHQWNLSELSKPLTEKILTEFINNSMKNLQNFTTNYSKIQNYNAEIINKAFQDLENILSPIYKKQQYIFLNYSLNTNNNEIKKLKMLLEEHIKEIQNKTLFLKINIGKIAKISYLKIKSNLKNYNYQFSRIWETSKYNLKQEIEQTINTKNITGKHAFQKLYNELTSSFKFKIELEGQTQILTDSEIRALRYHPKQEIRRKAMRIFFSKYKEHQIIFTSIYNNIVKDYVEESVQRGYKSPISKMNIENDLEDLVIETLHQETNNSYNLLEKYYKIKAKKLKLQEFTPADIYAPLTKSKKQFSWQESKEIILESFSNFDESFYKIAKEMFENQRIHYKIEKSKLGGAFCSSSTPEHKPYIMTNFLGHQRDIATIAHELGHAIHSVYSQKQSLINFHPILPLAETASVFCEMILTDFMIKNIKNKEEKETILISKLEDIFATSHRQNMFSTFEQNIHQKIKKTLISSEELCHIYKYNLTKMFGNSITTYPEEYSWEWASIPHIFLSPFYVYSYNFGNSLVISLYQEYLDNKNKFIPKFKELLSSGSSENPYNIIQKLNINIKNNDFWRQSIKYINSMIKQIDILS